MGHAGGLWPDARQQGTRQQTGRPIAAMRPQRASRPVGSSQTVTSETLTLVQWDEVEGWIYGPELMVTRSLVSRALPRGDEQNGDRSFFRLEFEVPKAILEAYGGSIPASLVVAEMPLGFASIHSAPLQKAGAKDGFKYLPAAFDDGKGHTLPARFNPLRFSADDLADRQEQSDLAAIAHICQAEKDIYLSKKDSYRASLASDEVSLIHQPGNPNMPASRWKIGHSQGSRKAPMQRLALVLASLGTLADVHQTICSELETVRKKWLAALKSKERIIQFPDRSFKLADALDDIHVQAAIDLSVWQALAGIDEDRPGIEQGTRVATLASYYVRHHLNVWNKALMHKQKAAQQHSEMALGMLGEASLAATQYDEGQLDALQLLNRIEDADNPAVRIQAQLEALDLLREEQPEDLYLKMRQKLLSELKALERDNQEG